jgi:hypothetical protein
LQPRIFVLVVFLGVCYVFVVLWFFINVEVEHAEAGVVHAAVPRHARVRIHGARGRGGQP